MTVQIARGEFDPIDGWWVTDNEAYTPEEWAEESKTCPMCGVQFVITNDDEDDLDLPPGSRKIILCSESCRTERHRQQSRESMAKARQARKVEHD